MVVLGLGQGTVAACGWWGDGESANDAEGVVISPDGVTVDDPMVSPAAMVRAGDRFRRGDGPAVDYNLAQHWYRLAAERGHPGGEYNLGRMYEHGQGVRRDDRVAASWYRLAAEQGEVHAQHHLAEMYRDGRGVARDPVASLHWYRAAARQGHAEIFDEVAAAYQHGRGTRVAPAKAYLWWWLAAAAGDPRAEEQLGLLRRQLGESDIDAAEADALALSAGWPGTRIRK